MRVEIKIIGYVEQIGGRKRPTLGVSYVNPEEIALITEGPYVDIAWGGSYDTSYITLKSGHSLQAVGNTTQVNNILKDAEEENKRILEQESRKFIPTPGNRRQVDNNPKVGPRPRDFQWKYPRDSEEWIEEKEEEETEQEEKKTLEPTEDETGGWGQQGAGGT